MKHKKEIIANELGQSDVNVITSKPFERHLAYILSPSVVGRKTGDVCFKAENFFIKVGQNIYGIESKNNFLLVFLLTRGQEIKTKDYFDFEELLEFDDDIVWKNLSLKDANAIDQLVERVKKMAYGLMPTQEIIDFLLNQGLSQKDVEFFLSAHPVFANTWELYDYYPNRLKYLNKDDIVAFGPEMYREAIKSTALNLVSSSISKMFDNANALRGAEKSGFKRLVKKNDDKKVDA